MSKAAFISRLELYLPETSRILAQHRGFTDGEPKLELILSDLRSLSAVWFHVGNVDAYGQRRLAQPTGDTASPGVSRHGRTAWCACLRAHQK